MWCSLLGCTLFFLSASLTQGQSQNPVKLPAAKPSATGTSIKLQASGSTVSQSSDRQGVRADLSLPKINTKLPADLQSKPLTDVLAGRCQVMFATSLSVKPYLDANRLRPLGVTTLKRMDSMPNIPTIAEAGVPGFEATTWHGLVAVAGTPRPVLAKLNAETNAVLKDPQVVKFLESQGAIIEGGTPEKFAAYIKSEIPKWAKVIKDSGARAD